jgi:hypothetical protein
VSVFCVVLRFTNTSFLLSSFILQPCLLDYQKVKVPLRGESFRTGAICAGPLGQAGTENKGAEVAMARRFTVRGAGIAAVFGV